MLRIKSYYQKNIKPTITKLQTKHINFKYEIFKKYFEFFVY